jgi:ribosomal protein uL22
MGTDKLESMQEKAKEKFEEKARQKQEEKIEGTPAKEEKKEEKPKPKKKVEIKKPVVSEATGRGEYMPISTKESVEVSRALRGKTLEKANRILELVQKHEVPIRYYRFNKEVPHRKGRGFGAGRFPMKTAKFIQGVLNNAVANAKYLNLDADKLYIKSIFANRGIPKQRQGRYTHLTIIVAEKEEENTKRTKTKTKVEAKK